MTLVDLPRKHQQSIPNSRISAGFTSFSTSGGRAANLGQDAASAGRLSDCAIRRGTWIEHRRRLSPLAPIAAGLRHYKPIESEHLPGGGAPVLHLRVAEGGSFRSFPET